MLGFTLSYLLPVHPLYWQFGIGLSLVVQKNKKWSNMEYFGLPRHFALGLLDSGLFDKLSRRAKTKLDYLSAPFGVHFTFFPAYAISGDISTIESGPNSFQIASWSEVKPVAQISVRHSINGMHMHWLPLGTTGKGVRGKAS